MADRYDAVVARNGRDETTRFTKIGAAFPFKEKPGFTIVLDAFPVPDNEGQVRILLFEPTKREDAPAAAGKPAASPDDPPF